MSPVLVFTLLAVCTVAFAGKPNVEPEYLDMLRAAGKDEEFAKLMGIDVNLVRAQEERSEEELVFTKVSDMGDILLTQEQEEQARQGILFSRYPRSKWTNNVIPYSISKNDFSDAQISQITSALDSFNSRASKLRIIPRRDQKDYVMVISGNGCYSNLGRIGGQQTISLQRNGCLSSGTIQHEFIHAAGFTHEHNRPDRDNSVKVLFENIPKEWHPQYEKANPRDFGNQLTYECSSVMHYPMRAPGTSKPAFQILTSNCDERRMGQRSGPTDMDIKKVDVLYP